MEALMPSKAADARCSGILTADERETIITKSDADETWTVYSCSRPMMRTLRKLAKQLKIDVTEQPPGIEVQLPTRCLRIVAPRKPRTMTEQQRAAARERLAVGRDRKVHA
jgi:hypothetical protein